MSKRLVVYLDENLSRALSDMARADRRTPELQLVWLAQEAALQRGLLQPDIPNNSQPKGSGSDQSSSRNPP